MHGKNGSQRVTYFVLQADLPYYVQSTGMCTTSQVRDTKIVFNYSRCQVWRFKVSFAPVWHSCTLALR